MYYSGEEIGTIVADFGSATTRIGFAGEDMPKVVQPSVIGLTIEESNPVKYNHHLPPLTYRANQELAFPIRDGLVQDWEMIENIWDQALSQNLKISLKGKPLLLAEKPFTQPKYRHKYVVLVLIHRLLIYFIFVLLDVYYNDINLL